MRGAQCGGECGAVGEVGGCVGREGLWMGSGEGTVKMMPKM